MLYNTCGDKIDNICSDKAAGSHSFSMKVGGKKNGSSCKYKVDVADKEKQKK